MILVVPLGRRVFYPVAVLFLFESAFEGGPEHPN